MIIFVQFFEKMGHINFKDFSLNKANKEGVAKWLQERWMS